MCRIQLVLIKVCTNKVCNCPDVPAWTQYVWTRRVLMFVMFFFCSRRVLLCWKSFLFSSCLKLIRMVLATCVQQAQSCTQQSICCCGAPSFSLNLFLHYPTDPRRGCKTTGTRHSRVHVDVFIRHGCKRRHVFLCGI